MSESLFHISEVFSFCAADEFYLHRYTHTHTHTHLARSGMRVSLFLGKYSGFCLICRRMDASTPGR